MFINIILLNVNKKKLDLSIECTHASHKEYYGVMDMVNDEIFNITLQVSGMLKRDVEI